MKTTIAALLALSTFSPVLAGEYQSGYSRSQTCTRNEYREEYVPGTQTSPGYVKSSNETIEVPCNSHTTTSSRHHHHTTPVYQTTPAPAPRPQTVQDTNDCSEGTIIGGLLGAGLAGMGSRGKDQWLAVPAGGVAGAMIGCQIDGG